MAGSLDGTTGRLNISTEFATMLNAATTLPLTGITHSVTSGGENKTETGYSVDANINELTTTDRTSVASSAFNNTNFVTGSRTNVTLYETTNVTLYESSTNASIFETTDLTPNEYKTQQSTEAISPWVTTVKLDDEASTSLQISNRSLSTNMSLSTTEATITSFVPSKTEIQNMCNNWTTVGVVASLSTVIVLCVLVTSVVCFFRLRHKWRTKIQLERKKTDIWSMATFNNTIVNENFNDYQLASPTHDMRKSSGFSDTSVRIYDPFSGSAPHTQFSFDNDIAERADKRTAEHVLEDSTLRRNTFSAPGELSSSTTVLTNQDPVCVSDKRFTTRDRSSTFTVGKKHKMDRHVLLSHEELVENNAPEPFDTPTHSYYVTEL